MAYPSSCRAHPGMPISLAAWNRDTATTEGHQAWQNVINQLREVDQAASAVTTAATASSRPS